MFVMQVYCSKVVITYPPQHCALPRIFRHFTMVEAYQNSVCFDCPRIDPVLSASETTPNCSALELRYNEYKKSLDFV